MTALWSISRAAPSTATTRRPCSSSLKLHRQHFPISRVYSPYPHLCRRLLLVGFASKKYHPVDDFDRDKWLGLHLKTQYYTVRLHVGAFCLPAFLEEMLKEVE